MDPVAVIGAGISGVGAAVALRAAGVPVVVLDRGRRTGGRMASKRFDGRIADTGASYFTASDPAFTAVVEGWRRAGLARPWTDTFAVAENGRLTDKAGPVRWSAPGGLRGLVEDLASGLEIRHQSVTNVGSGLRVDGEPASAVVLAMPDPQARRLLDPAYGAVLDALDDPFEPVLALTARWADRGWDLDGTFVSDDPLISWIADDGRRRGDDAPVLVAHSTSELAAAHLAAPDEAVPVLVTAVRDVLGLAAEPLTAYVHRWSFARPTRPKGAPYFLDDALVGVCGDGWSDKPRVEAAYLSGRALGQALAERLT